MPSAQVATALSCSFNMIEDYVQTMLPPVAQSLANCFTVVQNDREQLLTTELITVSNQNNLLRFFPDSTSNSGWNHEEVLVDGAPFSNIQKVVSFYQQGTLYALAHYDAGNGSDAVIGMQRTVDTDWGLMPFDPDLQNALGQMRQTDAFRDAKGVQFFYGVSEGFQPAAFVLVGQDPNSGTWEPMYMEPQASATATYRILPGYGGNQMTVVTVDGPNATFRGGSIVNGQLEWDGKAPVTHDLGQGPITAEQVFAVPSASGDQGFLLQGCFAVQHSDVNDNLAVFVSRMRLKLDPHPTVAFRDALIPSGRHCIRECKEGARIAANVPQSVQIQLMLIVQHCLQSLATDVARCAAIDCITDFHVIGGHALRDCPRTTSDPEKPAYDFLPGADLSKGPVTSWVEIDIQRFLMSVEGVLGPRVCQVRLHEAPL